MNRISYLLFVSSLILQMVVANFHYFGGAHFLPICFLTMNYLLMILIRDWLIGFELFFVEKNANRQSYLLQPIFLFGTVTIPKDPIYKVEKLLRKKINGRSGFIQYVLFSGWMSFCYYAVFPKLGLPISMGLSLSLVASWFLMNSYQLSHFLFPLGLSLLIVLLSFLKTSPVAWLSYLPFFILFFLNLSLYRVLHHQNKNKTSLDDTWHRFRFHFYRSFNFVVLFVFCTFITYQALENFRGKGQPKLDAFADKLKQKVSRYIAGKVAEHVDGNPGTKGKRQSKSKNSNRHPAETPSAMDAAAPALDPRLPNETKQVQEALAKLMHDTQQRRQNHLEHTLKDQQEEFRRLNSEFQKDPSQFKEIERRQALFEVEKARQRLKNLEVKPIQGNDLEKYQKDLTNQFPKVDPEKISEILQEKQSDLQQAGLRPLPEKDEANDSVSSGASEAEQRLPAQVAAPAEGQNDSLSVGKTHAVSQSHKPLSSKSSQVNTSLQPQYSQASNDAEFKPGPLRDRTFNEWQIKVEQILSHLFGLIKLFFVFVFVLLIYRGLKNLKANPPKADLKPVFGLTREKKRLVESRLQALRQQHLSPDQEALHTYRFFLETMALAEFPKKRWCPATEFVWQINQEFAGLGTSVEPITEAFCNSHYGKKVLSPIDLNKLRQAREAFAKRMTS